MSKLPGCYGGLIFEFSERSRVRAPVDHLVVRRVTFHLQLQLQSSIFCWRNRGILPCKYQLVMNGFTIHEIYAVLACNICALYASPGSLKKPNLSGSEIWNLDIPYRCKGHVRHQSTMLLKKGNRLITFTPHTLSPLGLEVPGTEY
jgi:hypothetical protein